MKKPFGTLVRIFVLLGIISLACGISVDSNDQVPAVVTVIVVATQQPPPTPVPPTTIPPSPVPPPTAISVSPTAEQQKFFTEEFDDGKDNWSYFLTSGDESDLDFYADKGMLVFDITGQYVLGQSHLKCERIAVSKLEAQSDGKTTCSKHSQALCRVTRPSNRKCKGAHLFGNLDHCDLCGDLWSRWME